MQDLAGLHHGNVDFCLIDFRVKPLRVASNRRRPDALACSLFSRVWT